MTRSRKNVGRCSRSSPLGHELAIKVERSGLEAIAERRFGLRDDRKRRKSEIFRQRVESTFDLFARGLSVQEVARLLNCSIRTAYRRKERFREIENNG